MKTDPTTICGMLAGAALAVAALPGLPKSLTFAAGLIAAAALGALGWHAKSCPPNCPGTDPKGNPRPPLIPPKRIIIPIACFLAFVAALGLVLLSGCTFARASTSRSTDPQTGAVTEHAAVSGWTLLDSSQALARTTAHSGYTTNGLGPPGISMSGLNQSSSSTGRVVIIQNVIPAAVAATPK